MQTKCKFNNVELFLKLFYIQSEEIGNKIKSTTKKQQNLKNSKVRIRLNIDVRKEKGDSYLNAVKVKG